MGGHDPPRPDERHAAVEGRVIDVQFAGKGRKSVAKHFIRKISPAPALEEPSQTYNVCVRPRQLPKGENRVVDPQPQFGMYIGDAC